VTDSPNPAFAHHAEADLSRFQDGLRVTHDGPPSHNTIIGHSYGTTVVGMTTHDHGVYADDIVRPTQGPPDRSSSSTPCYAATAMGIGDSWVRYVAAR
jgi:hypothetical protein